MYTTNLYMTYILLVWGWKVNGLRSSTQRICRCTELWAVKQTDGGKTSKTKPGLQPLKTKWQHSAHPLLSFIWPAVSSWDDQHSKLTRDGKWAPSQQDTPVQLVYTIVLKTCTKEALSSVTLPTPLMKYLISNLQPEEKKQNNECSDRSHRFTVNAVFISWHAYKAAVIELEKAQMCLNTHPVGEAVRALGSLRRPEQTVGMTN